MQTGFVYPNGLTVSTEIWNLHLMSDDFSNETENQILQNRMCTFNLFSSYWVIFTVAAYLANPIVIQLLF